MRTADPTADHSAGPSAGHLPDPMAALKAQLAAQAQDNPGLAMLMQLLEAQAAAPVRATAAGDDVVDIEVTRTAEPPGLDAAMRADLQALVQGSEQMAADLAVLQQRNDALAAALGACHLCFGADAWCVHCGGRGLPGSRRPEAAAFKRYVRPVLQRLQRATLPAAASAAPSASASASAPAGASPRAAPASPCSTEGLWAGAA